MAPENTSATPTTETEEQPKQRVSVMRRAKGSSFECKRKAYEQRGQNRRLKSVPVASDGPIPRKT